MHFVGFCGGAVAFYIMGFAIAFGEGQNGSSGKRFSGNANFALVDFGSGYSEYATFLFHLSLAITASAIVPGVVGDRCKLSGYLWYSVFLVGFVYPIAAHSIWDNNGFLSSTAIDKLKGVGVIDIAGSAVIHITGGLSALMTTMILGSRKGRFYDDDGGMLEEPGDFPINNVVLRILGTLIMWFCWYGVSSGSTSLLDPLGNGVSVGLAAVTVSLSAASGCLVSVFVGSPLDAARTGQNTCDLSMALNGCLSGLVAASAGCAVFEPWVGIIVGTVAGMINYIGSKLLLKFHIDDPIDAIPGTQIQGLIFQVWVYFSPSFCMR